MRGSDIPDEVRSQVIGALLSGIGVREAARQYALPASTVSTIKAGLGDRLPQTEPERATLDELLLSSLGAHVQATAAIARLASSDEYLKGQSAREVASLHEALANHAVRLLEAAALSEQGDADA